MKLQFGVQEYQSKDRPISYQRSVNMYPEKQPTNAKTRIANKPTPGTKTLSDVSGAACRGNEVMDGVLYSVLGTTLYKITSGGVATSLGTIPGAALVSMANDGTNLVIVVGNGYVYNGSSLTQITDPDYRQSDWVVWQDQYFIFGESNSDRFFFTDVASALSVDGLSITSAEGHPDKIRGAITLKSQLILVGHESIEVWYNAGTSPTAYQRSAMPVISIGCKARNSIKRVRNTFCWLGNDLKIYAWDGAGGRRISNSAIEDEIRDFSGLEDTYADSYSESGHDFYKITFINGNKTWVFDIIEGLWHQMSYYNGGYPGKHHTVGHVFCYDKNLCGDYTTGKIYEFKDEYKDDDGQIIQRILSSPPLYADGHRVFVNRLELDIIPGVGLVTGQGSDPKVNLRWSDDGGYTWSSYYERTIGVMGAYKHRVIYNNLGSFEKERVFELVMTDPVRFVISGSEIELEKAY